MQTRLESAVESVANITTGFIISFLVWQFVVTPLFEIPTTASDSFLITSVFTVTSLLRAYLWRRFFTNRLWQKIQLS